MGRFLGFVGVVALAVLAYGGQVKTLPAMSWLPMDLTLLSAAVVFGCVGLLFFAQRPALRILAVLGLWWLFLFPTFMVATTPYGTQKALTLFTFTLVSAVAPFFVLRTERQQGVFLATLVALAGMVGVMSYQSGALRSLTASEFSDISPIGIARLMGTGVVVLLVLAFAKGTKAIWRLAMFAGASGLLVMIFVFGRRGPVLAVVVGVVVALALAPAFRKYRVRALFAGVVALAAAGWYSVQTGSAGVERVMAFLNGEEDASTMARNQIWDKAIALIKWHPEGIGWGSFPQYADVSHMTNAEGRMYAHNLFFEGFLEGGWFIGVALLVFVIVAFVRLQRNATTPVLATFLGLFAFALANALVSGDINDSKLLWVAFGLAFAIPKHEPKTEPEPDLPAKRAVAPEVAAAAKAAGRASRLRARQESQPDHPDNASERPSWKSLAGR